jgi:recombination protein RecA
LTLVSGLVLDAQQQHEPVAWLQRVDDGVYPPDLAAAGVDLEALVFVRLPDNQALAVAADSLLRCAAFGLVVVDLGPRPGLSAGMQKRLTNLARLADSVLVLLTESRWQRRLLSPVISVHALAERRRCGAGEFCCRAEVLKDRRRGCGWRYEERCHGVDGLC